MTRADQKTNCGSFFSVMEMVFRGVSGVYGGGKHGGIDGRCYSNSEKD
jgi:hypothetical protein